MDQTRQLERELENSNKRYDSLDEKYKELERKCNELQAVAYESKEKLAHGQAEYQIKMVNMINCLQLLNYWLCDNRES